jgi:hypothetical protein
MGKMKMARLILFRQPEPSRVVRGTVKDSLLINTGSIEWFMGMFPGLHLENGQEREIEVKQLEPDVWGWSYATRSKRRLGGNVGQVNTRNAGKGFGKVIKASVAEHKKGNDETL